MVLIASSAACSAPSTGRDAHAAPHTPTRTPTRRATPTASPATRGTAALPAAPGHKVGARPPQLTEAVVRWQLPSPVSRGVAMRYAGGALVAGGLGPGDRSTDDVLLVRPGQGQVTLAGHLAEPLHDAAGGLLAGRPTVVGGGAATELADVEQRGAGGAWRVVGRLPEARSDLSVVGAGDRLLVVGGYDGAATPRAVLRTAHGSDFATVSTLPSGVRYAGTASTPRTAWIVGGERDGHELDEVLRLDLRSGSVRAVARLPRPLGHEAVAVVGGRLLVMGGRTTPDSVTDQMWWFDPRTRGWRRAGTLPYPVADAPSVVTGHHVYLFGGETPDFTGRVTRVSWRR
ncbi:MAG: hypothetical protein QOK15_2939 [Nocardioidaceae bacterium]|jgi:hypothetical protein|nr:hypothetical protein [Nocardioidaceae bacterium]